MPTFVLIGGAWHGAWCWKLVAPLLREAGYGAEPLSLTGLGERIHLYTPDVNLSTHIQDVVNFITYEDLHDVILVGHSYAGVVITGTAGRIPDRISQLIYFDSYVPKSGESLHSVGGRADPAKAPPSGRTTAPVDAAFRLGITDPHLAQWAGDRLSPHPYATFIEPVEYDEAVVNAIPHAFIACKDKPRPGTSAPFAEMAKNDPTWQYREIMAGHDAMLTAPDLSAGALVEAAQHARRPA